MENEDRTTFYIEADEDDTAELRNHLYMNGYDVRWNDDYKSFDADEEEVAYIETILEDRGITYSENTEKEKNNHDEKGY